MMGDVHILSFALVLFLYIVYCVYCLAGHLFANTLHSLFSPHHLHVKLQT